MGTDSWRTRPSLALSCHEPGVCGFLVNSITENWCGGAVLRGMSILAESSTRAAQIDTNICGMARLGV